jgi:hypothetical protein
MRLLEKPDGGGKGMKIDHNGELILWRMLFPGELIKPGDQYYHVEIENGTNHRKWYPLSHINFGKPFPEYDTNPYPVRRRL